MKPKIEIPKMKISELIEKLNQLKSEHGDINVALKYNHEYWGSIYDAVNNSNIEIDNAQLEGPKSGFSEKCVCFTIDNSTN
jgi:hypothetical protein